MNVASVSGYKPAPFTILGWAVPDIDAVVAELSEHGVTFERFPGMPQDERHLDLAESCAYREVQGSGRQHPFSDAVLGALGRRRMARPSLYMWLLRPCDPSGSPSTSRSTDATIIGR